MVILLFSELIRGDNPISEYFKNAKELWTEINPDLMNDEELINTLRIKQSNFETRCGGRSTGKIIFVLVGIGQYYDFNTGFEPEGNQTKAKKISQAFIKGSFSKEIEDTAKELTKIYNL